MRTKLTICLLALLTFPLPFVLSQVPQGFNYQAVAHDDEGDPIVDQAIEVRITIQSDSLGGTIFWEEVHSPISTNNFGMFSLVVGKGTRQIGSTAASFGEVDWTTSPKFLKTDVNYNGWKTMGSTRIWSVPYSLVAENLEGPLKKLTVEGETSDMEEPLFEVKNMNGQTVFAVYNEGVRIYVDDGDEKGLKGGFAIGGLNTAKDAPQDLFIVSPDSIRAYIYDDPLTKPIKGGFAIGGFNSAKGITNDYLLVSPDSVRVYIDDDAGKGLKGGFAIGGINVAKGTNNEYLRVTDDSTRVYVNEQTKGLKGGFAIGAINTAKGSVTPFTALTPENYFIGHRSGLMNTTGIYNSFVGYETGFENTTGSRNVLLGYQAGQQNSTGGNNVFIGNQSGYSNTSGNYNVYLGYRSGFSGNSSYNTLLGYQAGYYNTGNYNSFIGYYTGRENSSGSNNVFAGFYSGYNNSTGNSNVYIGNRSGYNSRSGSNNVFLGYYAGYADTADNNVFIGYLAGRLNVSGSNSVLLGHQAGRGNTTGASNVVIGYNSGYSNQTGSNNVVIGNLAGFSGTAVNSNVFLGDSAGYGNTNSYNVFLGKGTGKTNSGQYNAFMGYHAGMKNTSGSWNVFIGYQAGYSNTTASYNTFVGYKAGEAITTGTSNVFFGTQAGATSFGSNNAYIGDAAGAGSTNTSNNVYVGSWAGTNNYGQRNILLGANAGRYNHGSDNIFIGYQAGYDNTNPHSNSGSGNIYLGNNVGLNKNNNNYLWIDNKDTSLPLIWGDFANRWVSIDNKLGVNHPGPYYTLDVTGDIRGSTLISSVHYIGNYASGWNLTTGSVAGSPLEIRFGSTPILTFNVSGSITCPSNYFYINSTDVVLPGSLWVYSNIFRKVDSGQGWHYLDDESGNDNAYWYETTATPSDMRFKEDIRTIEKAIDKVIKLTGVSYYWNEDAISYFSESADHVFAGPQATEEETMMLREEIRKEMNEKFSGQQIGLIAQEVEKIIPGVVHENKDGYKEISYGNIVSLLVEAVKEQQHHIEMQDSELQALRDEMKQLKTLVSNLNNN